MKDLIEDFIELVTPLTIHSLESIGIIIIIVGAIEVFYNSILSIGE